MFERVLPLHSTLLRAHQDLAYATVQMAQLHLQQVLEWAYARRDGQDGDDSGGFYDLLLLPDAIPFYKTLTQRFLYIKTITLTPNPGDAYVNVYESQEATPMAEEETIFTLRDTYRHQVLLTELGDPVIIHALSAHVLTVLLGPDQPADPSHENK